MPADFNREIERAYIAGIIDGEGCIFLKRRTENSTWLQPMISIRQKKLKDLQIIKKIINKRCYFRKPKGKIAGGLSYASKQAYEICKETLPYLRFKKDQTQILIEFYENYKVIPKGRRKGRIFETDPELWEQRKMCFWAIKRLKQYAS